MLIAHIYKYKRKFNFCYTNVVHNVKRLSSQGLRVLFFGKDEFSVPSLQALRYSKVGISDLGVVTSFNSPSNCVKLVAEDQKIPIFKWPLTTDISRNYDLGVVVSFGHLIPEDIISSFSIGMINVHASILPRWRGAAPIIHAIMNGDTKTGVSIMKIRPKKFDVGDVLAKEELEIGPHTLMPDLHRHLSTVGATLLLKVISGYPESFKNAWPQNDEDATYAPKITASTGEINWTTMSSEQIYNLYRALYGFKDLKTKFDQVGMKLIDLKLLSQDDGLSTSIATEPGCFDYIRETKSLRVICADNRFIEVQKVKVKGKRAMSATDFHNGFCKSLSKCDLRFKNR